MRNVYLFIRRGIFFFGLVLTLFGIPANSGEPAIQENGIVEVNIRNSTFEFQGGILKLDQAAIIVVHNLDKITHGFTSSLFEDLDVQVEANGITTIGKGIKGVHIDSGKTARIHFLPSHPGKFTFRCDLHPNMKGELLVLSIESI